MKDLQAELDRINALAAKATAGPFTAMRKPPKSWDDHGWRAMAVCGDRWMVGALLFAFVLWLNLDADAATEKAILKSGDAVCEQHGGLESLDNGGDFTCKNGVVIHLSNGSKP
ncbi:hypothetical protein [Sphingomonas sp.]|jgi:hypothetical protein|uniref:hypothetical protein n=1 Tax=Sphingomonas sp. TaxID=28214 RepID=UPI00356A01DF